MGATELLIECRHCLAWSYVWLYYENDKETSARFQEVQNRFETKIEKLSDMLEGNPKRPHAGWLWMNYYVNKDVGEEMSSLITDLGGVPPDPSAELAEFLAVLQADVEHLRQFGPPAGIEAASQSRAEAIAPQELQIRPGRARGRGRGAAAK